MSYAAIHCSHATHKASCCSSLRARQGAYLWNAMSLLDLHIGMNGSSFCVCVCMHLQVVYQCFPLTAEFCLNIKG